MELAIVDYSALHFPRREWRWLRRPARYATNPLTAPDAFLWAARVGDQLWAWHPGGTDIETGFAGMKTRVLILRTDGGELEAHGLYLKTTFDFSKGQDVEWVAAIQVLTERLGHDPAKKGLPAYWREALEACDLTAHLGVLAQRGRYGFLTHEEQQLLFDRRWDLSTFELLETMSQELRSAFIEALRKWNLGANHAKEAANFVLILAKKLGEKSALSVLTSPNHKSAEELRTALMRVAQPELAALSQKRIDMLRGLHIPPRCSVYGDPAFENDILKITHTPRNIGDFEAFKSWVSDSEVTEKIRALLEIYQ